MGAPWLAAIAQASEDRRVVGSVREVEGEVRDIASALAAREFGADPGFQRSRYIADGHDDRLGVVISEMRSRCSHSLGPVGFEAVIEALGRESESRLEGVCPSYAGCEFAPVLYVRAVPSCVLGEPVNR